MIPRLILLICLAHMVSCRAQQGEPCYKDEMCVDGLICHERYCESEKVIEQGDKDQAFREKAAQGLALLVQRCGAVLDAEAGLELAGDQLESLVQEQVAVPANDSGKTVSVDLGGELFAKVMERGFEFEEARMEAMALSLQLYEGNPVFRGAVRSALRETLAADEPGPAMPPEIEFCSRPLLQSVWRHLGEPEL